jgi:hypothetical protein
LEQNPNQNLQDQLKEQFNFEQHTLREDPPVPKEEDKQGGNTSKPEDENKPKYDKSIDFFDSLTNST